MNTRKVVYALLTITICLVYWFLWLGLSNIISSLIIYTSIFFAFHILLGKAFGARLTTNGRVLFTSICLSIIILELGLRTTTDKYQSYSERNGSFWYACRFSKIRLENLILQFNQDDLRLYVSGKSTTYIDQKPEFSYHHTFNSNGLRNEEICTEKIDSSFVIVGFGDSFTEGVGAPQDSNWVALLEDDLTRCKGNLLAVNAGKNGSDIVYEAYKLVHLIHQAYKPRLVIFSINTSDIGDLIDRGGGERFVAKDKVVYKDGPWWKYLYSFSYVWRAFVHEVVGVELSLYSKEAYQKLEKEAKNLIYSTIMNEIVPFARDNNIQTLFVFTPGEHELDNDSFALAELSAELANQEINVLNLHKDFSNFSDSNTDYYWDIDGHCKSQGYLLWSKAIANEIEQQGLIKCD